MRNLIARAADIVLLEIMHSIFLSYLGMHHVVKVPRRDAAECTAIAVSAGVMLSTIAGCVGITAGLFPQQ